MGILEQLLSSGDSSRLYQRMVKGDKVALEASAGSQERRGPGFFYTFVLYKPENKPEKIRQIVFNELDKFKTQPVSQEELEKARNQILRGLFSSGSYSSLQRSSGKAELLAEYTSFFGDPKTIDEDLEAYMKVTPQDVQRVAKSLFDENGATIVDIIPADKEEKPQDKADQDAKSKQEKSKKSAASTKETKAKGKS
jgi:zinc protease